MFDNCKEKEEEIHPLTHAFIVIFFSFKNPKHDEENGDKEGSWKPSSGVNHHNICWKTC